MSLPEKNTAVVAAATKGGKQEVKQIPLTKPGKNQVLVKIEYAPLNPTDIISLTNAFGWTKAGTIGGKEGSGTVVAVGEDLKVPFKVGDRVHVLSFNGGAMAQYFVTETDNVSPIQDGLSFEDAASHFINPGTVYHMGITAQRGGHKAVIHTAGASSLGKQLIRYLKHLGIKSINIVRRDEYIEELKKEGADYVLNLKDPNFEKDFKEIATKEKATMALEAIAGDFTNKVLKAQPPGSICYVYGALSFENVKNIDISELFQKKSITGLLLTEIVQERSAKGELQQLYKEVHELLPTVFKTEVQKIYKLEEIEEAIAYNHEHSSKGKILLKPN